MLGQFDLDLSAAFMKGTGPTASDRFHRDEVPTEGARDRSDDPIQLRREDCLLQRASQLTSLHPSKVSAPAATAFVKGGVSGELSQGCSVGGDLQQVPSRCAVSDQDVAYPAGLTQPEAMNVSQVVRAHLGLGRHLDGQLSSSFEAGQPVLGRRQVGHLESGSLRPQERVRQECLDPPGPEALSPGETEIGTHVRFAGDAEPGTHRSGGNLYEVRTHSCGWDWDPVHPADDSPVGHD